jgi:pantoate--beta-alanine ligase
MRTVTQIGRMQGISDNLREDKKTIGFVPTMGFLHEGHLSLVDEAKKNADVTIASIFVNPTQFAPGEDFEDYPRDIERDKKLLEKRGCSFLFYPPKEEMYGEHYNTEVIVKELSRLLCGMKRKTHFCGVTTVVAKLFNIIKPHIAVFGQKDGQQAIIIKRMVKDLNFDVKIIVAPTVREKDGLALSSRNMYLTRKEREEAPVIYHSLKEAERMIKNGVREVDKIVKKMNQIISSKKTTQIEYIEIVDTQELRSLKEIKGEVLVAVACQFGKARLIDNIIVKI